MSSNKIPTLHFQTHTEVSRPTSPLEYFQASFGQSPHTLDGPREVIFIVEGGGCLPRARWQAALDQVVAKHPGARLRLVGKRLASRWQSDGAPARLRIVPDCAWDGRSHVGAEFITAQPLPLETGPTCELIVAESGDTSRVIVRASHAVMDGRGVMFFFYELFRALRGEALLGSNANFSDVDLMRAVGARRSDSKLIPAAPLTGGARGREQGDVWRRISIAGRRKNTMLRVMMAAAEFARARNPEQSCLFSLPIDLRRHFPELNSTQNFSSMLMVSLAPGEGEEDFKRRLNHLLKHRMDTHFVKAAAIARALPMAWIDGLMSRKPGNYYRKKPLETLLISHLGYYKSALLSCDGFKVDALYGIPLTGSSFCLAFGLERHLEVIIGMPRVYGSEGRYEAFMAALERALDADT